MEVKDAGFWEKTLLERSFRRKQKITLWSSWAETVGEKVAEMWGGKKMKPYQSNLLGVTIDGVV